MFGVPIDGPCRVFNDNQSVVKNSSRVELTLTKRHNQLAYHVTRWAVATGSVIVSWIPTNGMLADPLTKRMSSKASRDDLFYQWICINYSYMYELVPSPRGPSKGSRTRRHSRLSHELLTWPSIYVVVSNLFLCPYFSIAVSI